MTKPEDHLPEDPLAVAGRTIADQAIRIAELEAHVERLGIMLDPKLLEMHLKDGSFMFGIDGKGFAMVMADAFWKTLTDTQAENYVSMTLGRGDRELEVIIQKRAKKTPHEMRREAERDRDELLALLNDSERGGACVASLRDDSPASECDGEWSMDGELLRDVCWEHRRRSLVARITPAPASSAAPTPGDPT